MKYLSNYIEEEQTEIFNKYGAFFAFSTDQFNEKKIEGVEYVSCGYGLTSPKENAEELNKALTDCAQRGREKDLEENGKFGIIRRELYNHEAFYVYNTEDTFYAVEAYGFTREDVKKVFAKVLATENTDGD